MHNSACISGHSRLLRELLWAFSTGQDAARLSVPLALGGASGGVVAGLRWDGGAADGACASLASEHTKLSNCGAVPLDSAGGGVDRVCSRLQL